MSEDGHAGAETKRDVTLRPSAFAKLTSTGLLDRGRRAALVRVLRTPDDPGRWFRLAEFERMLGNLEPARRAYRAAHRHAPDGVSQGEADAGMIADMLGGDPVPVARRKPECRVEPFLYVPSPIPPDVLKALEPDQSGRRMGQRARVGPRRRLDPAMRQAMIRDVPTDLLDTVLNACEPLAKQAARLLFDDPVEITHGSHNLIDYGIGGGYVPHRDVAAPGNRHDKRVLTLINYVWRDVGGYLGGHFVLHDRSGVGSTRILPNPGMTVAIRADSVHEVSELIGRESTLPIRRTVLSIWYDRMGDALA